MNVQFPWLTVLTLLPLVAAFFIPVLPDREGKTVRWYALAIALLEFGLSAMVFWRHYDAQSAQFQMVETVPWLPQIGLNWSLAVDGLAVPLILLTGLVNTLAIFAAWQVKQKPRLFYFLMLALYSAQIGVFAAQDLILFFLIWELELVPVYLLISIWGGAQRQYAATKFILYTAVGSLFILIAGLGMAFYGGDFSLNMAALGLKNYPLALELLAYAGFLIAFGVKLPIFPLHTWLPDAHGEASAPVSMVLAGVLLKMGGYGLIRFNLQMLPDAHIYFAPVLIALGVVNIIYGALTAFGQENLKRRLAYSSISHMGFVLLGIGALNGIGLNGAMLQMLSHGLIAAVLFFLAGVTYDRTHTLAMEKMSGIAQSMPKTFALFTASSMASLALPGMSGFVSELTVFLGLTNSDAYSTTFKVGVIFLAAVGVIITPVYLLSMVRRVFTGKQAGDMFDKLLLDINPRETFIALSLLVPIIAVGMYPKVATQTYDVTTTAIARHVHGALPAVAQHHLPLYAQLTQSAPRLFRETTVADNSL
ncbi:NAD(P)H-quinone oxidoreductase subunit 4 [Thermosynechococcus vestitus]|uniref:NAD(P)H-quinone oxidoreductase chain 4 2 n=1 Tax=Thermosynechococcus vestitus (strain NIES-2133 / IAM M-273 / BP-1) TaxID=197221 RepID=NU4C2_THEVB|nr:NAD(P)H-quinone oxidoreductase subunit 4 [Thermosynechococcus vestitus]Q8DHX4.1 RecName: Full=NAD(P)H-quinone oxidoreductase chain 4 2; AltName: Full=NAD(P)H dehydrogenase I, chain 4 2; AltName: Full=NDH-1, chain 4 2 [Thermosynechococcus vestitus BP-1]BAC09371.1 NADH dehydrogenase subunit 4 [Thermosynechococcus vestitus BP-1]